MGVKSKLMRILLETRRSCPRCWKQMPENATFCPECGDTLSGAVVVQEAEVVSPEMLLREDEAPPEVVPPPPPSTSPCSKCAAELDPGARFCASCGEAAPTPRRSKTAPIGGFDLGLGQSRARIAVLNADGSLRRIWPITADRALIGSSEGDVLLERDPFVAPRHARLSKLADGWSVEDLRTVNGTFRRVPEPTTLEQGDYFRAGQQLFRITSHAELFGKEPPALPPREVQFFGSPGDDVPLYAVQMLANRKVGHVVSLARGAPRVIGRDAGELRIADEYLSGRHLQLELLTPRTCRLTDLGSTNGVSVRITQASPLHPGDLLILGETLVRFELS